MLTWFSERWNDLLTYFYSLVLTLFDMLKDIFYFIIESFLNLAFVLINSIEGAFTLFSISQYLNILPDSMLNVMSLVGVDEISAIIVSAVIVRFTLQLIPFVRLGS